MKFCFICAKKKFEKKFDKLAMPTTVLYITVHWQDFYESYMHSFVEQEGVQVDISLWSLMRVLLRLSSQESFLSWMYVGLLSHKSVLELNPASLCVNFMLVVRMGLAGIPIIQSHDMVPQ